MFEFVYTPFVSHSSGLVTTIIPVFNRESMLRVAVESVLNQTYRPIEVVVVDDGSTDSTGVIADRLAEAHPLEVRVIHQSNTGVGSAREAGRLAARGEFIQHLDSDDILLPEKFEKQVAGLRSQPECGASYGWTRLRFADGTLTTIPARRTGERMERMFPAMLQSRWWHTPTPLYRASVIAAAGPWLNLRNEEDWEYDARIASQGFLLHYCPEWICEFRHHNSPRLSGRGHEPNVLRDRARAHSLILEHARRAGLVAESPEMRHFARELFLLSRQTGAAGLETESRMLFELSRSASAEPDAIQFRLYRAATALLGWNLTGRMACLSDRLR